MVVTYGGYSGGNAINGIRGVEPSAQTGFQYREIHITFPEIQKSQRRINLEERKPAVGAARVKRFHSAAQFFATSGKFTRGYHPFKRVETIRLPLRVYHPYPLAYIAQMRRCVQTDAVTVTAQDIRRQHTDGTLTFCAGYMDNP
jgi:hypothetical protein